MKYIGSYTLGNCSGIGIKNIEYGTTDRVQFDVGVMDKIVSSHDVMIRYSPKKGHYFLWGSMRVYFSDVMWL
jgi:hypothetical protein